MLLASREVPVTFPSTSTPHSIAENPYRYIGDTSVIKTWEYLSIKQTVGPVASTSYYRDSRNTITFDDGTVVTVDLIKNTPVESFGRFDITVDNKSNLGADVTGVCGSVYNSNPRLVYVPENLDVWKTGNAIAGLL